MTTVFFIVLSSHADSKVYTHLDDLDEFEKREVVLKFKINRRIKVAKGCLKGFTKGFTNSFEFGTMLDAKLEDNESRYGGPYRIVFSDFKDESLPSFRTIEVGNPCVLSKEKKIEYPKIKGSFELPEAATEVNFDAIEKGPPATACEFLKIPHSSRGRHLGAVRGSNCVMECSANIRLSSPTESTSGACIDASKIPSFQNCPETHEFKEKYTEQAFGSYSAKECSRKAIEFCSSYFKSRSLQLPGSCGPSSPSQGDGTTVLPVTK